MAKLAFFFEDSLTSPFKARLKPQDLNLSIHSLESGKRPCQSSTSNPRFPARDNLFSTTTATAHRRIFLPCHRAEVPANDRIGLQSPPTSIYLQVLSPATPATFVAPSLEAIRFPQRNSKHCDPSSSKISGLPDQEAQFLPLTSFQVFACDSTECRPPCLRVSMPTTTLSWDFDEVRQTFRSRPSFASLPC